MVPMPRKQSVVYPSERMQPVLVPKTMARVVVMPARLLGCPSMAGFVPAFIGDGAGL
jgi:hypothetical protein